MRRTSRSSLESTADAKNGALFNRKSIDSSGAWPVARMPNWQAGRQPQSGEMHAKPDVEALAIGESGGSGWIWLIWWIGLFGGMG
jgi:hypothetical protein